LLIVTTDISELSVTTYKYISYFLHIAFMHLLRMKKL